MVDDDMCMAVDLDGVRVTLFRIPLKAVTLLDPESKT
jgi:hypothetical protein